MNGPVRDQARLSEWFVPRFGPIWLRSTIGLLFLPYTGMVLSFAAIGSLLAPAPEGERVGAIALVYFLGLGVGAHALDALGARTGVKPWGRAFSRDSLILLCAFSLAGAYAVGGWYIARDVPWLGLAALLEGFFVFAYNLEWFGGYFHSDLWFAFSWGALPVVAGQLIQMNGVTLPGLLASLAAALLSLVQITASRPYKELKRSAPLDPERAALAARLELILKSVSLGVITLAFALLLARFAP